MHLRSSHPPSPFLHISTPPTHTTPIHLHSCNHTSVTHLYNLPTTPLTYFHSLHQHPSHITPSTHTALYTHSYPQCIHIPSLLVSHTPSLLTQTPASHTAILQTYSISLHPHPLHTFTPHTHTHLHYMFTPTETSTTINSLPSHIFTPHISPPTHIFTPILPSHNFTPHTHTPLTDLHSLHQHSSHTRLLLTSTHTTFTLHTHATLTPHTPSLLTLSHIPSLLKHTMFSHPHISSHHTPSHCLHTSLQHPYLPHTPSLSTPRPNSCYPSLPPSLLLPCSFSSPLAMEVINLMIFLAV